MPNRLCLSKQTIGVRHILKSESLKNNIRAALPALSVNSMKLSEIQNHAAACVNCLELDGAMRRRLQDIGFVPGARICFAYRSPLGDPNAYFIGGALVALRRSEAEKIDVTQTR